MNKKIYFFIVVQFLLLICFCLLKFSFADTIILKSGKRIDGKILQKTDKFVKIEIQRVAVTYFLEDIRTIIKGHIKRIPVAEIVDKANKEDLQEEGEKIGQNEEDIKEVRQGSQKPIEPEQLELERQGTQNPEKEKTEKPQSIKEEESEPIESSQVEKTARSEEVKLSGPGSLSIDSPFDGAVFSKGSIVEVKVSVSEDIEVVIFSTSEGVFEVDKKRPFKFTFKIPDDIEKDSINIVVVAKGSGIKTISKSINLTIH